MRKDLLGAIVGFGMMIAQSAGAADMIRYDKSASNVQPEQTVAQVERNGNCKRSHATCPKQCPPRHYHHKHHSHHHKHSVKKQQGANHQRGNMSSKKGQSTARKTSSQRNNTSKTSSQKNNKATSVEEYIDEVGREHR